MHPRVGLCSSRPRPTSLLALPGGALARPARESGAQRGGHASLAPSLLEAWAHNCSQPHNEHLSGPAHSPTDVCLPPQETKG